MQLSKVGYYADFVIYPFAIVALAAALLWSDPAGFARVGIAACVAAMAVWTLIEYIVHRFVLHSRLSVARYHAQHHDNPRAYVGTPTWISVVAFFLLGFVPLAYVLGGEIASSATIGLMAAYLWYLLVHDAVHRWTIDRSSLFYRMKLNHARHHYAQADANFGVTTMFWDKIFGTYDAPRRQRPQGT